MIEEEGVLSSWLGVKFNETLGGDPRLAAWGEILNTKLDVVDHVASPNET